MKKIILLLVTFSFALSANSQTIVETAVSNNDFSTLVTALKSADLVGALSGEGPFTVFAPNNAAFAKIDSETLSSLLEPANVKALSNILTYHVVSGKLLAADVANALKAGGGKAKLKSLNGQSLTAILKYEKIYLIDAKGGSSEIIATDVIGTNGVIHVVDTVVMPE